MSFSPLLCFSLCFSMLFFTLLLGLVQRREDEDILTPSVPYSNRLTHRLMTRVFHTTRAQIALSVPFNGHKPVLWSSVLPLSETSFLVELIQGSDITSLGFNYSSYYNPGMTSPRILKEPVTKWNAGEAEFIEYMNSVYIPTHRREVKSEASTLIYQKRANAGVANQIMGTCDVLLLGIVNNRSVQSSHSSRLKPIVNAPAIPSHFFLYSPPSAGNVGIWVHNKSQQFLVENDLFSHFVPSKRAMISSGVLIMDYNNAMIRDCFVPIFQMCAYTRKCIAPVESSLNNHRFDQAVVSLLIAYYGVPYSGSKYRYHPVLRRDGGNNEAFLLPTLHNLFLKIQDAYSIKFNNSYYETRNITYTREMYKYISRPLDKEWPQ